MYCMSLVVQLFQSVMSLVPSIPYFKIPCEGKFLDEATML